MHIETCLKVILYILTSVGCWWASTICESFYTLSCCSLLDTQRRELQTAFHVLVEICLVLIDLEACFTYALPSETNFIRISLSYLS